MPGKLLLPARAPSSSTAAVLAHHASLRARIEALRARRPADARLQLSALLSGGAAAAGRASSSSSSSSSPPVRALRASAQRSVQAHAGANAELCDVALAALDAFVSTRVRGARAKACELFARLCESREWSSLAVFSASSVAEEALRGAGGEKRRFTVIDCAPEFEGRALARRLARFTESSVRYGVLGNCQRLLDGAHVVVIGAEEVTMNGCVLAAPGASVIAQVAKEIGIPVIVTTQAVKFSEGMVVDWTFGGFDVLKADEVLLVVTEMEMSEVNMGIGPWMAPDVWQAVSRLTV